ncbi:MAG: sigma-70 family RNA polymerase sigma factor [Nitriliruptoraceae bacterium]
MPVGRHRPVETQTTPHWHGAVVAHYDLVQSIVRTLTRNAPLHVDREELHAAGLLGLVDAAKRFTSNGATPFSAYASVRIRGAIIDAMRRHDWAPRGVRAQIRQVHDATDVLHAKLQRTPTTGEIADYLGWDTANITQVLAEAQRAQLVSLAANDHGTYDYTQIPWLNAAVDPAEQAVNTEQCDDIAVACHYLPDNLRQILTLRLIDEWSLSAISAFLNVTDARVSQLVNEGLNVLRAVLHEMRDDVPAVPDCTPGSLRRERIVAASGALRFSTQSKRTVTHGTPNSSRLTDTAPPARCASQPAASNTAAIPHAHTMFTPFKRSS